jgi:hypothetical protein
MIKKILKLRWPRDDDYPLWIRIIGSIILPAIASIITVKLITGV